MNTYLNTSALLAFPKLPCQLVIVLVPGILLVVGVGIVRILSHIYSPWPLGKCKSLSEAQLALVVFTTL